MQKQCMAVSKLLLDFRVIKKCFLAVAAQVAVAEVVSEDVDNIGAAGSGLQVGREDRASEQKAGDRSGDEFHARHSRGVGGLDNGVPAFNREWGAV